jgi:hypothetical protein
MSEEDSIAQPSLRHSFTATNVCQASAFNLRLMPLRTPKMPTQVDALLRGWRALRDELKLLVLSDMLPRDQILRSFDFEKLRSISKPRHSAYEYHKLLLLLSIPEIAGLVNQVLYSQNTLSLSFSETLHPPQHMRHHVRKVTVMIGYMHSITLHMLRRVAKSTMSYAKLQVVRTGFRVNCRHPGCDNFLRGIDKADKILFRTKVIHLQCDCMYDLANTPESCKLVDLLREKLVACNEGRAEGGELDGRQGYCESVQEERQILLRCRHWEIGSHGLECSNYMALQLAAVSLRSQDT